MALDMTPEQKATGQANFHRVVGTLAENRTEIQQGVTRRQFMQGMIAAGTALPLTAAAFYGYSNSGFSDRPVKAGIIGTGDEGGVLVGEHNPNYVQFVAYSDIRPTNQDRIFNGEPTGLRKGFNHHYGRDARSKITLHENYQDLLADPQIEMVVIALPLHLHAKVAIDALRAGKHVLCEKLMAWNITLCKQMIAEADRANKLLAIGHQRHYSMLYAHANDVVNSGVLGDVKHIRALWHRNNALPLVDTNGQPRMETVRVNGQDVSIPMLRDSWRKEIPARDTEHLRDSVRRYGWKDMNELVRWRLYTRTGGGLMAELGSHQLDACSIFLGKKHPIAVNAYGGKHFYQDDRESEDHVYCTFEFPGANYNANRPERDEKHNAVYNDIVTVTYSSINTNDFERYGECVMGSKGTMVVEQEQNVYLWGGNNRATAVTTTTTGGRPALDTASSGPPEQKAQATGQASVGFAPPSRGYREEMEHFAFCIRMRDQGMNKDRADLKPRCDGRAAMADAIIALTSNLAMRQNRRIVFDPRWFEAESPEVPDRDMIEEPVT